MKRSHILLSILVLGAVFVVGTFLLTTRHAEAQGLAGNQEQQAAQAELEKSYPQMNVTDQYLHLSIPGYTMGQTIGVATNSKGQLFVYSRSVNQGIARGGRAAMLWEFDENDKFVKEWGPNNYAESFAHAVRVDKAGQCVAGRRRLRHDRQVQPGGPEYLLAWPDAGSDGLPAGETSKSCTLAALLHRPRTRIRPAGWANSTERPMWLSIRRAISSCLTVTATRASSRFRRTAIG